MFANSKITKYMNITNKPVEFKISNFITFNYKYLISVILLFFSEVIIAIYFHDQIIRPYFGDTLVVILIYCFIRTFFKFPVFPTTICVLLFAFIVETLQYFNFVAVIGLEKSKIANIVLGNSFAWNDIIAYILGGIIILIIEKFVQKSKKEEKPNKI